MQNDRVERVLGAATAGQVVIHDEHVAIRDALFELRALRAIWARREADGAVIRAPAGWGPR